MRILLCFTTFSKHMVCLPPIRGFLVIAPNNMPLVNMGLTRLSLTFFDGCTADEICRIKALSTCDPRVAILVNGHDLDAIIAIRRRGLKVTDMVPCPIIPMSQETFPAKNQREVVAV